MYTPHATVNQGSPSFLPGSVAPAGMVLISETELAAMKAEIATIKSMCEETRTKLETMRTEAAASQPVQITTSESNSTANTSPAGIPVSAASRKKRDSDVTVSTRSLVVAVKRVPLTRHTSEACALQVPVSPRRA